MTPKLAHTLDSLANEFQYDPSGRWGVETVGPIREAARIIAALEKQPAASGEPFPPEDPVTVPRGLLGAACAAIERKHDAPKTLAALRRYTVGDLSATAQPAPAPVPLSQDAILDMAEGCTLQFHDLLEFARKVERAHGIAAPARVPLTDEQAMEIAVTATPPGSMASRHQIVEAIRLAERHHGIFPSKENPL